VPQTGIQPNARQTLPSQEPSGEQQRPQPTGATPGSVHQEGGDQSSRADD
jgi:hypothetical protein